MEPIVYKVGNLVGELLRNNICDDCGSSLKFSYVERIDRFIWCLYTKCPNGCFEEDEYNLFTIEGVGDGRESV